MIKGILRGPRNITYTILKVLTTLFYRGGPIASRGGGGGGAPYKFSHRNHSPLVIYQGGPNLQPITCMYYLMVSQHKCYTQLIGISARGDGDEMDVSFNKFITFFCDSFQMASVISVSIQQPTFVKC